MFDKEELERIGQEQRRQYLATRRPLFSTRRFMDGVREAVATFASGSRAPASRR